ncbi:MAG: Glu-tRNA(Gln) amidotransferase subunit GatE [Nanoarchaeota archaeon]|nr:Glu-tRNA(Gln) amidotransferase subunit GatE [Nanoarchaeota archaeon]
MIDYQKLGFKCGIEIHQQLETNKLFCNCPSLVNDENKPDVIVKRRLRIVDGESGEKDKAAGYEKIKNKEFIYESCSSSSCLIELDEEPPLDINKEALKIALEVGLLLKCKIVDKVNVMRKIVIDGSNPGGFQRTMLIGYYGEINTSKGVVKIDGLFLEEEAAKKIKEDDNSVTYRLDRLGVPLVEIATDASIKDNEHAKEVASLIGMMLRSTEKVKRGIGSIRQDLNISIKKHPRVEVKGFQELRDIPKAVEIEVNRQLKENKGSHVRYINKDLSSKYLRPMPGAARMYPETDVEDIEITKEILSEIKLPELIVEKVLKLEKKYKISDVLANEIVKNKIDFEDYLKRYKLKPELIGEVLINIPKEFKKRFNKFVSQEEKDMVLDYLSKGLIDKNDVINVLLDIKDKKLDLKKYKKLDVKDLEKEIKDIVEKNKDLNVNGIMGIVMKKYRGKVDGKKVFELIKKFK